MRISSVDTGSDTKSRDSAVAIRSPGWMVVAALTAALLTSRESEVQACSFVGPGIFSRSVWPGPDQHPPTNTRIVVSYKMGADFLGFDVPKVGPDVALLDGDGTPVAFSFEVVASQVVIRPATALLPNHLYQIADRRTVPCDQTQNECTLANESLAFASFTTGPGADTAPPAFAGLASIAPGDRLSCDNGACCGTYDVHSIGLSWLAGLDDSAGGDLRYNVYRRAGDAPAAMSLLAGLVTGTELRGFQTCSGQFPGSLEMSPGTYVVRAVDWAGNEDSNATGGRLDNVCSGQGCSMAGPMGASSISLWWVAAFASALVLAVRFGWRSASAHAGHR